MQNTQLRAGLTVPRRWLVVFCIVTLTLAGSVSQLSASDQQIKDRPISTLRDLNQAFIDIAAHVKPAVVTVSTEKVFRQPVNPYGGPFANEPFFNFFFGPGQGQQRQPQEREYRQQGLGSGIIVSEDGYILTNNHVVDDADSIFVRTYNGNKYTAKVIGTDKQTDVAVLKIDATGLDYLEFGNSDSLQTGEIVLAIGSPMSENLAYTVTQGIVSATGRSNVGLADYEDFIQTDAAINPGNSGGPLVNLDGDLVGINAAIVSRSGGFQGIGFAVPSAMAKSVMTSLISGGKVVRGWLGVYIQEISDEIAKAFHLENEQGALISEVVPDSPAGKAGVEAGDIVKTLNGKPIRNGAELRTTVASLSPGSKVTLEILREGKKQDIDITLGELPEENAALPGGGSLEHLMGFTTQTIDDHLADQFHLKQWPEGVIVTDIDAKSAAYEAGLRSGDVIVSVNRYRVKDEDQYREVLSKVSAGDTVLLQIARSGRGLYLAFRAGA